jgi:4-hydroxy-2-oxoheptanedioate aldolase
MDALPRAVALSSHPGSDTLVRVPWNRPEYIMRALDAGADGVIIPMVNNPTEAADAVAAALYPPAGGRSWGPLRADIAFSPETANERTRVYVMVETREGLESVDEIAAVDGLSGIYIGPNDLALDCGWGRRPYYESPPLEQAIETIREACSSAGIVSGLHAIGVEHVEYWAARGFGMLTASTGMQILEAGLAELVAGLGR